MRVVLTTASVADADRVEFWNQAIAHTLGRQLIVPRSEGLFTGRISTDRLGYLKVATIEADAQRLSRMPHHTSQCRVDCVFIGLQDQGRSTLIQNGRTAHLGPGELVIYTGSHPYTLHQLERFRMHVFQFPRKAVLVSDAGISSVTAKTLPTGTGLAAILAPFFFALAETVAQHPPHVGERMAVIISDLLVVWIGELAGESEQAEAQGARQAIALRVRDYINQH